MCLWWHEARIIYISKRYSCACIIIQRMSNSAENTTSTVGTASESRQGGIPLTESAPLSHNPFVHVTLDATERSKQVEQPPARPVGQPMPIWAQQRAFGHMPDKNQGLQGHFLSKKMTQAIMSRVPGRPISLGLSRQHLRVRAHVQVILQAHQAHRGHINPLIVTRPRIHPTPRFAWFSSRSNPSARQNCR